MSQAWRWGELEWGPFLLVKGEVGKELAISRVSPRTLNNKCHARCWDEHQVGPKPTLPQLHIGHQSGAWNHRTGVEGEGIGIMGQAFRASPSCS